MEKPVCEPLGCIVLTQLNFNSVYITQYYKYKERY